MTNRDLNYSRLFDVHRWSDHPEVNALEDRLYEVHLNPPVYGADIKSPPQSRSDLFVSFTATNTTTEPLSDVVNIWMARRQPFGRDDLVPSAARLAVQS